MPALYQLSYASGPQIEMFSEEKYDFVEMHFVQLGEMVGVCPTWQ